MECMNRITFNVHCIVTDSSLPRSRMTRYGLWSLPFLVHLHGTQLSLTVCDGSAHIGSAVLMEHYLRDRSLHEHTFVCFILTYSYTDQPATNSWNCQCLQIYRAKQLCKRGLGNRNSVCPSVCLSVCPSVTRVLCDETKEHTADILIPHERVITLVFCSLCCNVMYCNHCWTGIVI